jgi:hypothetical protein
MEFTSALCWRCPASFSACAGDVIAPELNDPFSEAAIKPVLLKQVGKRGHVLCFVVDGLWSILWLKAGWQENAGKKGQVLWFVVDGLWGILLLKAGWQEGCD